MYHLLETLRVCAVLLTPFIPDSSAEILAPDRRLCGLLHLGERRSVWLPPRRVTVVRGDNLFPRIDAEKALSELEEAAGGRQEGSSCPHFGGGASRS